MNGQVLNLGTLFNLKHYFLWGPALRSCLVYVKEMHVQGFGVLLFMWGGLDFIMSMQEVDVYYDWFGIYLPDAIYNYSHWIAMALGSVIFAAGKQSK